MDNDRAPAGNFLAKTTYEQELRAFDRLPDQVRAALQRADSRYSAVWVLKELRTRSVDALLRDIERSDRTNRDLAWKQALVDLGRQVAKIKADIMARLVGRRRIR